MVCCSGISSAYGGVLSALDITYSLTPIDSLQLSGTRAPASAKRAAKYIEEEIIQAIYPLGKRDVFVSQRREIAGHAL